MGDADVPPVRFLRGIVVGGSALECLFFVGFGGYLLWLGIALNGRGYGGFANDLNFLAAAALLALAAGIGVGAFLMSFRWFEASIGARIMGAVLNLGATAVAAWVFIGAGVYQIGVDRSYGYWPPWIAFAIGAGVIAVGISVLTSLLLPIRRKSARRASQ